jgi:hypothetical protein
MSDRGPIQSQKNNTGLKIVYKYETRERTTEAKILESNIYISFNH